MGRVSLSKRYSEADPRVRLTVIKFALNVLVNIFVALEIAYIQL